MNVLKRTLRKFITIHHVAVAGMLGLSVQALPWSDPFRLDSLHHLVVRRGRHFRTIILPNTEMT